MFYAVTDVHGLESDCKKEEHRLSVNDILEFVSDAHQIPPMTTDGFQEKVHTNLYKCKFSTSINVFVGTVHTSAIQ